MKKSIVFFAVIFTGLLFIIAPGKIRHDIRESALKLQQQTAQSIDKRANMVKPDLNFGKFSLYFIRNKGQMNEKAKFYAKTSGYTLWITKEGLIFDNVKKVKVEAEVKVETARDVSRFIFLNANKNPEIVPVNQSELKVNYFIGNDQSQWQCDIPTSKAVLYKNLYKNIDLKVYGIEKQIEYDWVVKPGGNPGDIKFQYKNIKGIRLDNEGNLVIETGFGELVHKKPVGYQRYKAQSAGRTAKNACPEEQKVVNVIFKKINKNTYGFEVGEYDKSRELIIDPVILAYSTYLGGSKEDNGFAIALDNSGYVYITGLTWSTNFPMYNHYQGFKGGYYDAFITKIDTSREDGPGLLYSAYLGGNDTDAGFGIAVDSSGYAYVTGSTDSKNFPTRDRFQTFQGHEDVFITKIDTTKTGASSLIYSTCLGGSSIDFGYDIAVDSNGHAYVTGFTSSSDFPLKYQYQTEKGESYDAFVVKLDPDRAGESGLLYSTYLGGSRSDYGWGIDADNNGNAYVTGYTTSPDFPNLNQYQPFQGRDDAFVTKIDTTRSGASGLIYSTYLGGSLEDYSYAIAADSSGNVYVTGKTESFDFPHLGQYQTNQPDTDAFVTKIDTNGKGKSALLYSTYLGGSDEDYGFGITVDVDGYVLVTGSTVSKDFPVINQNKGHRGYYYNAFVTKLDMTNIGASSILYSLCLGGEDDDDYGRGITADSSGNVYITGYTESHDFPVLGPYQADQIGTDVFVAKLVPTNRFPRIRLNRASLNFGVIKQGPDINPQTFSIDNTGGGKLNWIASTPNHWWLQISPTSGTAPGVVTVGIDTSWVNQVSARTYNGTILITDIFAVNSPQTVSVTLNVYEPGQTSVPFGIFATPIDNSHVSGSIPVTGWVLDDIGVQRVQIYSEAGEGLIYIGDAVFVEGARPDVQQAYPWYPKNDKAGWGYMMLTNFLPNGGNGTFKIHAIATDIEGNQVTLGIKTINCDNANAVKPFGAIDIPTQGGPASGSNFVNFGWALTPLPNTIPIDGAAIIVWVDGVPLGNAVYNRYRKDIALLFPGYNNSDGAGGYYYLDTTQYTNGVHTIQWTVTDDAGNTDGIGSRYFSIQNPAGNDSLASQKSSVISKMQWSTDNFDMKQASVDETGPIQVKKGYNRNLGPKIIYPEDAKGEIKIEIEELERLEILFSNPTSNICRLPIGSNLDRETGVFTWQPGAGFIGEYHLVFLVRDGYGHLTRKRVLVEIVPRN